MRFICMAVLLSLFQLAARAQCPNVGATKKRIASSFHSSVMIDYTGAVQYWGETANPTTGATAAVPGTVATSLFSGTPLAVAASSVATGTNGHGMYLLTTDSLYGWGSINSTAAFSSIRTIQLPANLDGTTTVLTAANVETIASSGGGLAIITKIGGGTNGEVYVRNLASTGGGTFNGYGDGSTALNTAWHQVKTNSTTYLHGVARISYSQKGLMALTNTNQVYVWGDKVWAGTLAAAADYSYATQISILPSSTTPVDINIISKTAYDANTAAASQFILGSDGKVYGVGEAYRGVLGQGNETDLTGGWIAVKSPDGSGLLTNIVQISSNNPYVYSGAYYSIGALNSDGQLYMWGDNSSNMIGGTSTNYLLPSMPPNFNVNDARVGYMCMGGHTTLAFLKGSNRFCYIGHRTMGSMGDGTTASTTKSFYDCINTPSAYACPPPAPLGCPTASANDLLASSVNATIVINGQPAASYWGQGSSSAEAGANAPLPVTLYEYNGTPKGVAASAKSITATEATQMWMLSDEGLWGWGYSGSTINALAGNTSLTKMALPAGMPISNVSFIRSSKAGLALVTNNGEVWIKAGINSACLATIYGDASSALDNNWHQVTTTSGTPIVNITELSFSGTAAMAINSTGNVYVWGTNVYLGNNTAMANLSRATLMTLHPDFNTVQVPIKAEVIQTGTFGAAQFLIGTNGKVYALGGNLNGALGIGSTTDQTGWSVLSLANVIKLSSNNPFPNGSYSIGALTVTGTLYLWGSNADGMLGGGATTQYTSPTIPALTALGAGITATDNINGFEIGGRQTLIFTKPISANPDNKFLFSGYCAGGAKGDVTPVPAITTYTSFTMGAGVINCAGAVYNLTGRVIYDPNGLKDNGGGIISGIGINNQAGAPLLYVNLIDEAGNVINTTTIGTNGAYAFSNLPAANYTIQISTASGPLYSQYQPANLPADWSFVGEQIGTAAAVGINTGSTARTGRIPVTLSNNVSNVNIGLEQRPVATAKSFTVTNGQFQSIETPPTGFPVRAEYKSILMSSSALSGYAASGNGSMSGSDAEDCSASGSCNTGSSRTFKIATINANTELWYYNGNSYAQILAGQTITEFMKSNMVIYGQVGSGNTANPLGFTYSLIDAAGAESIPAAFIISTGINALPVVLKDFRVAMDQSCTANLSWNTGTEDNINGFEIQHSIDGIGFSTIDQVKSTGSGSNYFYKHLEPQKGANFYRLVIRESNGIISFSNVVRVDASCGTHLPISISPNPVTSLLKVQGSTAGDLILIYNSIGLRVKSLSSTGNGEMMIDMNDQPSGIYLLQVQDKDGFTITTIRIQKQ